MNRNSLKLVFTYKEISKLAYINWLDIFFGIEQEYLYISDAQDFASFLIEENSQKKEVLDILIETDEIEIFELIKKLAYKFHRYSYEETLDKYAYFVLNRLYSDRCKYTKIGDILFLVDDDFGFIPEVDKFAGYHNMSTILSKADIKEKRDRDWKEYLLNKKEQYLKL